MCARRDRDSRLACTYLASGRDEAASFTQAGLDLAARSIAAHLQDRGLAGERALLMFPAGVDFLAAFLGCLYAGVVAVPVPAPAPGSMGPGLTRLGAIAADASPRVLLTVSDFTARRDAEGIEGLPGDPEWIATDRLPEDAAADWLRPGIEADGLAFLQYTSGSTSRPKGVMVTHGNLKANLGAMYRTAGCRPGWVTLSWLPNFHDMGLVGGLLLPLLGGFPAYLMSPTAFVQRPLRWLQAIGRYGVNLTGGPNFAYEHCVRRVPPSRRQDLDLSSWETAFNGSEPVRAHTLRTFLREFSACGLRAESLYPTYGMAEATLQVSADPPPRRTHFVPVSASALEQHRVEAAAEGDEDAVTLVGCGAPAPGFEIAIADPESCRRLEAGEVGEIWLAGPSVAGGYWRNPEATREAFRARLAQEEGSGPWFRTGDLGFLRDGQLFVTGRLKELVILDGRNHYPHDIEGTAEASHPALRSGAVIAFAVDDGATERLVVVCGVRPGDLDDPDVAPAINRRVAEIHEVRPQDVVLVPSSRIPKTSSGKLQRSRCRSLYLRGELAEEKVAS